MAVSGIHHVALHAYAAYICDIVHDISACAAARFACKGCSLHLLGTYLFLVWLALVVGSTCIAVAACFSVVCTVRQETNTGQEATVPASLFMCMIAVVVHRPVLGTPNSL